MSLELTLIIVVFGIAGVVLLVHLTGGSAKVRLNERAIVLDKWHGEFPYISAKNALLDPDYNAALIDLMDGRTGILWAFGNDVVGRVLESGKLGIRKNKLIIDLPDFTAPHLVIRIDDPATRLAWIEKLETVLTRKD